MRPYALWKYLLLIVALAIGLIYAVPNLYGEDPSVQITLSSGEPLADDFGQRVGGTLSGLQIVPNGSRSEGNAWIVRLASTEDQLRTSDALKRALGDDYTVALNLNSRTPEWLRALGAKPMALGLDLRGGVHFLLQVDVGAVQKSTMESLLSSVPSTLRNEKIRYSGRKLVDQSLQLEFSDAERLDEARSVLRKEYPELQQTVDEAAPLTLVLSLAESEVEAIQTRAVEQNLITLRNRVNQLGVAEPLVQRQGPDRIVVQLPGVQDPTRVKELLGATATLEYRAVIEDQAATLRAAGSGVTPPDTELYFHRDTRQPYLLKREVIASGDQLIDAASTVDENGQPAVTVRLNGQGARRMQEFTENNVGKPMAVLLRERRVDTSYDSAGNAKRTQREVNEIISVANIRGVFGARFQTTGLQSKEAHDLALLLKSGALAAPVDIVEERTIGPSLGADNIRKGFNAAALGLAMVAAFMIVYYRMFGLFAVAALTLNMLLLIAGLSILQATLTMPGIAALVLTMGISVDANVLIYERIREELRNGMSPHRAIEAGYDRAFLTIADANITTIIAAVVLIALGAGPVRGFAVVLAMGIVTSQFTAIIGSRALAHLVFEKKARMKDLPIW